MVSPRSYFVFTPLLASTSVGTLEFRTALEPVRSRKKNAAQYLQGYGDDVDFYNKTVTIEEAVRDPFQGLALTGPRDEGKTESEVYAETVHKSRKGQMFDLSYDKLIISVGSYSQTFGIPGVREYANFLKDIGDARKIRRRLLECFETAALPTTPDSVRSQILNFAVVGGGPTGIEFSAELHDLIRDDLLKIYPALAKYPRVTIYDVAPTVLSGFDQNLMKYAMEMFRREGINIKTSRHVESLSQGLPNLEPDLQDKRPGLTLKITGEGQLGIGMVVWSTGLMPNPFIRKSLSAVRQFPADEVIFKSSVETAEKARWSIRKHEKTGSIMTNDRLRVILEAKGPDDQPMKAFMRHVFAIGDCAVLEGTRYPATAQVASQKAEWLAQRLNKKDLHTTRFHWKNLGVMAYIGNWKAIVQGGQGMGDVSGRTAWIIWRYAFEIVRGLDSSHANLIPQGCVSCKKCQLAEPSADSSILVSDSCATLYIFQWTTDRPQVLELGVWS